MEVLKVTTVFVHDNDKTQTVHCSDGTQGVMQITDVDSAPKYDFKFYGHAHPGFYLDADQYHSGEELKVEDVLDTEEFQLKFG